jgi:WD40 repeat protein
VPGYEILGEIGRGGMGVVYKARQVGLGRLVALKMVGGPAPDEQVLGRFRSEAEAIARLRHPNIIQVYEVGTCPAGPYFAMEFAEGGSLADRWDGSPQPPRPTAALVAVLARAVHAAHACGIVHRDLKPANVLLVSGGVVSGEWSAGSSPLTTHHSPLTPEPLTTHQLKIGDFGLARRLDECCGLTQPGQVMGTPGYMAPEQARGPGEVGPPADIYALGVLMYEALTGGPPYRGMTDLETVHLMLSQEPVRPSQLRPNLPRDLETICLKCLHKEPHKRYASAAALADDLERYLAGRPIHARPTPAWERAWKWARRQPGTAALAGLVVALAVLGFVLVTWQWRRAEGEKAESDSARRRALHIAEAEALARRRSELLSNQLLLERGVGLCESGDVSTGLLWLARTLEVAPPESAELQASLRRLLGGWGRQVHPLRFCLRPGKEVVTTVVSADGRAIFTATAEQVQRWDAGTGRRLGAPRRLPGKVFELFVRPDGVVAATLEGDAVRLWSFETGRPIAGPFRHGAGVRAVALSRDGKHVLTGGDDKAARLWDVATGRMLGEPLRHAGVVRAAAFSPDGTIAATGGEDHKVRGWDVPSGKPRGVFPNHTDNVLSLAFSPDSKWVASGGEDYVAMVWNAFTGATRARFWHQHGVVSVAFSPDGRLLATASDDSQTRLWTLATGRPLGIRLRHFDDIHCVNFGPDSRTFVTASADGTARVYRAADPERLRGVLKHPGPVNSLAVHPDGKHVLTGCGDGVVRLWDLSTGGHRVIARETSACSVAFAPDGKRFAVGTGDRWARVFDTATGRPLGEPLAHGAVVRAVAFSADGKRLLTGCDDADKVVRLWDLASGKLLRTFVGHDRKISAVAFQPGGSRVLTASWDRTARLWDLTPGAGPAPGPLRHEDLVQSATFSRDGRLVLTAGDDYTARLWEVASGKPVGLPLVHPGKVNTAVFRPDGLLVACGGRGKNVHLWETATGKLLGTPLWHPGEVYASAFGADGRELLAGCSGGEVRRWEMPEPQTGDVAAIQRWLHLHTGLKLDGGGAVTAVEATAWDGLERRR